MNTVKHLFVLILLLFAFSSCKSFKNLTARDNSNTGSTISKKSGKEVRFLDMRVTPGNTAVATRHSSKSSSSKKINTAGKGFKSADGFNIENADWLQFKYAIITDATVETLRNLELLKVIDYWYGTKYCIGGNSTTCIDCSAFTQNVLRDAFNTDIPRTAQEQFNAVQKIDVSELKEGDLVFFNTAGKSISHVGIYLLNNKFVHAATSSGVMVSDLNEAYWKKRFRGAGRSIPGSAKR